MRLFLTLFLLIFATDNLANEKPSQLEDGWPIADAQQYGWNTTILKDMGQKIDDGEFKLITSILIAQDGHLLYEQYFNNGHRDYMNDLRSATKSVTSTLVGIALDRNELQSVDQKVLGFFPEKQPLDNPHPEKNNLTLEDLLTMSSMMECNDDNRFSRGNEERMYIYHDWVKFFLNLPVKGFAPWEPKPEVSKFGRAFSYCTAGSFTLGAIVQTISGVSLHEYAKKYLEQPLGIHSSIWSFSPHGYGNGAGGTRYRSRDFMKLGELFRNGGVWQEKQIISSSWVSAATQSHVEVRQNVEYGYQWWRYKFDTDDEPLWSFAAVGNGGNYLFVQPDLKLVALITSEAYSRSYMHPQSQRLYRDFILAAVPRKLTH